MIVTGVNLNDPGVKAVIRAKADELAADAVDAAESTLDDVFEELITIRDALETARRHLTAPKPNPSEAMIYIERALEAVARSR